MSFLAPLFLLGALAAAAPVIFHLIRRTTRERTPFSSVMFLLPSPPRLTHRSRLEHILLLLLRCLALGLLALGFSRPFFRQTDAAAGDAAPARRLVLLVDVSANMRRTGLWAAARDQAAAILRTIGPADEAAVFTFGRQTSPLVSFEEWKTTPPGERAALAASRLAAASPGWGDTRLGNALISASEALADTDAEKKASGPRQIYLISSLTEGGQLESLQSYDWPKNVQLVVEPLKARSPTNAGLQLVAESPDADRLATPAVRVRVSNASDSARERFQVGWVRPEGGNFVGPAVDAYVPPGQSRVMAVPVPANTAGLQQIALRGDDEDFDNTVYVVPPEKQHWDVLYFGAEAAEDSHEPLFFLQRALPDNPHLVVRAAVHAPSAPVSPAEAQDAKMFFVTDALSAANAAELRAQMLAGKTVFFAPKTAQASSTLAQLLGVDSVALEDVQPSGYAMFGEINFQHPLFAPFADPRYSDFTKIHIWKYRRLNAGAIPAARVIARFDSGDPALVEVPVGQGLLLILLTGWVPDDSQLGVSSKFVPLLQSALELGGGPSDETSRIFVGDPIPLHPSSGAAQASTVRKPDGTTVALPAGAPSFAGTDQPGIYIVNAGTRPMRVGVNVAASESRTAPLSADELERYGAPGPKSPPDAIRAARRDALLKGEDAENRQKLWRTLLVATLLVLLLESAIAGWTARQSGLATEGTKST